jgi:hypothetical protein
LLAAQANIALKLRWMQMVITVTKVTTAQVMVIAMAHQAEVQQIGALLHLLIMRVIVVFKVNGALQV